MATIQGVYVALFGRPADPTGLAYFNSVTKNGADLNGIGDLASTQEYKDRFKDMNNAQIVNSIYQSLFGRDAETAGLNFFVDALNKGTLNIKNIAIAILDGAQGNDKTIVTNKVAAADLYTKALDTAVEIASYQGNSAAAQGRTFLSGVTTTVPTAASVDTSVASMVSAGNTGNTIALTAAADSTLNLTTKTNADNNTTDKNDTINATAATNTWTAADIIDGGFGTDTLNAKIDANVTVAANALKSVEIAFITGVTNATTVDVANAKELQQVWDNASSKALTVSNIALGTTVGLKGAITEATTFNFANATGTSDSATVAVDGATSTVGATIANIETLTISNTGTSNVGTITAAAATVVNLTGAGTLTVALADGAATTVNNTSTGSVVADLSAATKLVAYNGSAASDDVKIDTAGLTANVTLSGGAGADTLRVTGGVASSDKTITLTGGDGSDLFFLGNGAALTNVNSVATAADLVKSLITISDFTKAADSITFKGTKVDLTVGQAGQVSAQSDLLAAATKAVEFAGANKATVFAYGGDTYIVNDTNNSGAFNAGDALVKITGVAVADLTTSNLTFN